MEDIVTPQSMLAVGIVMPVVAGVAVGVRVWTRWSKSSCLREHDYLILAAYLMLLATGIMLMWGGATATLASLRPAVDDPFEVMYTVTPELVATEKMKFAYDLLVNPAIGLVKLSVLTWYRKIFCGRAFNAITITMIVIISLWIVASWFAFLFQCGTNFEAFWSNSYDLLTKCNEYASYHYQVLAIPGFVTDVVIVSIPVPMLRNVKMEAARRIGLCFVFLFGALACVAALTRLLIYQKSLTSRFNNAQDSEVISVWMFWSQIELGVSITAACLPTMAPLLYTRPLQTCCNSLHIIGSNLLSVTRFYRISPYKAESNTSHESRGFGSDDMLFQGSCARVRTSVTANTKDVERGVDGNENAQKPGVIVATTDISQYHVDRDDLSPT